MAKAQYTRTVTETRVITEASVTLTLTEKEAIILMSVIGLKTNGSEMANVYSALEMAGVEMHPEAHNIFFAATMVPTYDLEKIIEQEQSNS